METYYRKKFYENYTAKVLPKLVKLEKIRLESIRKIWIPPVIFLVLFIMLKLCLKSDNGLVGLAGIVIFIVALLWLLVGSVIVGEFDKYTYKKLSKKECLKDLVSCLDFIDNKELNEKLFDDTYSCVDDAFTGNYKGVDFSINEISVNKRKLIIKFKSSKIVKTRVQIVNGTVQDLWNKVFLVIAIGGLLYSLPFILIFIQKFIENGDAFSSIPMSLSLLESVPIVIVVAVIFNIYVKNKKVNLEDVKFEDKYSIISDDQIEARYLFTPSFMERFRDMRNVYGEDIFCVFEDNNVTFTIYPKRDLFEFTSLYTPATSSKLINRFFNEITAITDMIDALVLKDNLENNEHLGI